MDTLEKRKPGRPARVVVDPAPVPAAVAQHVIPLPHWMLGCAIDISTAEAFPADIKARVQAELGCRFAMTAGAMVADDGRRFQLVLHADRVELL